MFILVHHNVGEQSLVVEAQIGCATSRTIARIDSSDNKGTVVAMVSSDLVNSSGVTSSGYSSMTRNSLL